MMYKQNVIIQTAPIKTDVKQQEIKEDEILKEISQSVFQDSNLENSELLNELQVNNYYQSKAEQIELQNSNQQNQIQKTETNQDSFFKSRKQMQKVENGKTGKVNYEITKTATAGNDNIVLQSQLQTDIKVKSASQQFELYKEFVFKQYEKKNVIMNQNLEDLVSSLLSAVEKSFRQFKKSGPEKKALVVDAIINYMLEGDQSVTAAYKALIQTLVELIYEKYNCCFDEIFQNVFSSQFVEEATAVASGCLKGCMK